MLDHVMVDIETHSTQTFAAIASIAAVSFNPYVESRITGAFQMNVDPKTCEEYGLHFDPKVAEWWAKLPPDVQAATQHDQRPLEEALDGLTRFFHKSNAKNVWSQGAAFDIPILDNCYSISGRKSPWNFTEVRDTRTIYDVAGFHREMIAKNMKYAHVAEYDVMYQVKCVQRSYRMLMTGMGHNVEKWASDRGMAMEELSL